MGFHVDGNRLVFGHQDDSNDRVNRILGKDAELNLKITGVFGRARAVEIKESPTKSHKIDRSEAKRFLQFISGEEVKEDQDLQPFVDSAIQGLGMYRQQIAQLVLSQLDLEQFSIEDFQNITQFLQRHPSIQKELSQHITQPVRLEGPLLKDKATALEELLKLLDVNVIVVAEEVDYEIPPHCLRDYFREYSQRRSDPKNNFGLANSDLLKGKRHYDPIKREVEFSYTTLMLSDRGHLEGNGGYPKCERDKKITAYTAEKTFKTQIGDIGLAIVGATGLKNQESTEDRGFGGTFQIGGTQIVYAGVADGHGGDAVSDAIAINIQTVLQSSFEVFLREHGRTWISKDTLVKKSLVRAVYKLHALHKEFALHSLPPETQTTRTLANKGSTLNFTVIIGKKTFNVNLGDSRAVGLQLGKQADKLNIPIALSRDMDHPEILDQLKENGGEIVRGKLFYEGAMDTFTQGIGTYGAVGDIAMAPMIRMPDITVCDTPLVIVMGCDGVFEAYSSNEVVESIDPTKSTGEIAKHIFETAYAEKYPGDDTTVVVLKTQIE